MSRIALVVLVSLFSQLSFSQETFPSRAVTMIVPFLRAEWQTSSGGRLRP